MSKANIQVSIDNGRLMTKLAAVGLIFSVCFLILTAVIGSMRGGDVFRFGMITYALSAVFSFGALIYGMLSTQAGLENEEKQLLADRGAAENRALNVDILKIIIKSKNIISESVDLLQVEMHPYI